MITLLDYGAGNVRSVINAIESLGENVIVVSEIEDILSAEKLVFPGVGNFENMMRILNKKNYVDALKDYLLSDRPFFGICVVSSPAPVLMHASDASTAAPILP